MTNEQKRCCLSGGKGSELAVFNQSSNFPYRLMNLTKNHTS